MSATDGHITILLLDDHEIVRRGSATFSRQRTTSSSVSPALPSRQQAASLRSVPMSRYSTEGFLMGPASTCVAVSDPSTRPSGP